jgi:hypothetical protein
MDPSKLVGTGSSRMIDLGHIEKPIEEGQTKCLAQGRAPVGRGYYAEPAWLAAMVTIDSRE